MIAISKLNQQILQIKWQNNRKKFVHALQIDTKEHFLICRTSFARDFKKSCKSLLKNKSILRCDNTVVKIWLGLGLKTTWLGLGKDQGLG